MVGTLLLTCVILQGATESRRWRRRRVLPTIQSSKLLRRRRRRIAALPPLVRGVLAFRARGQILGIRLVLIQQPRHPQQPPHQVRPQLLHDLGALAAAAAAGEVELAAEEGREDVELLRVGQRSERRRGRLGGPRARRTLELHRAVAGALAEGPARLLRAPGLAR